LHGRIRTWQLQAQLFFDRVHNTIIMGQRLSVVMATILLISFVLVLTIEDNNIDIIGNAHQANIVSQVKANIADKERPATAAPLLPVYQEKPNANLAATSVSQHTVATKNDVPTETAVITGQPVVQVQRVAQQSTLQLDKPMQQNPKPLESLHVAKPKGHPPNQNKANVDQAFVRPADVPDDVPDWALRPAVDMPFFADEVQPPPPSGSEHVKRCIQMGRPLDVCLSEGTEVAEIEKLYRAIPTGTHAPMQAYPALAQANIAVAEYTIGQQQAALPTNELNGLKDEMKHKSQQIERMQRVMESNLCKTYLEGDVPLDKYEMWTHGYSDAGQDRVVALDLFKKKRSGVFLEIGAAEGQAPSSTWILDKCLDWHGVCIEPHATQLRALGANRPNCKAVQAVVGAADGPAKLHKVEGHSARFSSVVGEESEQHTQLIKKEIASYGGSDSAVEEVPRYKGDDLLKNFVNLARVDLVSIDVGSGLMHVLDGLKLGQVLVPEVIVLGVELVDQAQKKILTKKLEDNRYALHRTLGSSMIFKRN
jgi:FkbM family methyltransferase